MRLPYVINGRVHGLPEVSIRQFIIDKVFAGAKRMRLQNKDGEDQACPFALADTGTLRVARHEL